MTKKKDGYLWLYDLLGVKRNVITNGIDFCIDERFLQSYTLSFKVPATNPKVIHLAEDITIEYQGEEFIVSNVGWERIDNEGFIPVEAEATWIKLGDIIRVGNTKFTKRSVFDGLDIILSGTFGWVIGTVNIVEPLYSFEATDASVLDCIWQFAKVTGNEVSFDTKNKRVSMTPIRGINRPYGFRYGRNLKSIKRTAKPPIATRLYMYGRNDLSIASSNAGQAYIEDYSFYTNQGMTIEYARAHYRRDQVRSDDSFVDGLALYATATTLIASLSQPQVTYEMTVVDLSSLLDVTESNFRPGDTVFVWDEIFGLDLKARVTRYLRYPLEPHRNSVELTYGAIVLPDGNIKSSTKNSTIQWELYKHDNGSPVTINSAARVVNEIAVETGTEEAEAIFGFSFHGVASGSGTLHIRFEDSYAIDTDPVFHEPAFIPFSNGQVIKYSTTWAEQKMNGQYIFQTIMEVSSGAGTVRLLRTGIDPLRGQSRAWMLCHGFTKATLSYPNSIIYESISAIQYFTVPLGVTRIMVEAYGSQGNAKGSPGGSGYHRGGLGGHMRAEFNVEPEQTYEIFVGGAGNENLKATIGFGDWPNGGNGNTYTGSVLNWSGNGGGGSSHLWLIGGSMIDALLVAAGGGGKGSNNIGPPYTMAGGGFGGYDVGGPGDESIETGFGLHAGGGANLTQGGRGGDQYDNTFQWQNGLFGQGGGNAIEFGSGPSGGGGGYFGGGQAGYRYEFDHSCGGGGGVGYFRDDAINPFSEDGVRVGDGIMTISWKNPGPV